VPNFPALTEFAKENGIQHEGIEDLIQNPKVKALSTERRSTKP
jgi:hypothetical protein